MVKRCCGNESPFVAFYVAGWEGSSASPDAAAYAAVRFIRSLCFVYRRRH